MATSTRQAALTSDPIEVLEITGAMDDDPELDAIESSDEEWEDEKMELTLGSGDDAISAEPSRPNVSMREDDIHSPQPPTAVGGRDALGVGTMDVRPGAGRGARRRLEEEVGAFEWQKSLNSRDIHQFSGRTGVETRCRKKATTLDIFQKFFTMSVIELVVNMTNLNAQKKIARSKKDSPPWSPLTIPEFLAFLGLLVAMGIARFPTLHMYWQKKDWLLDIPVNKVMSRDRFIDIWRYLHFCDEDIHPDAKKDKLYRIRPLLDLVLPQFESTYLPGQEISIDESMIPFKGRIAFRQFIPSKRTRFGIKVWVLAESKTGYVSRLQLYTGKDPGSQETGLAARVVNNLITPYEGKGYHLYVDNFYTSPELFQSLYDRKVYACGTLRVGRKHFPKDILLLNPSRLPRGKSEWTMAGPILAQSWLDSKPVYFLSTIHSPEYAADTPERGRFVKRRGGDVPCPPLLHPYNSYMGGVDLNDQMRKYYNLGRRSRTWYRRIFFYLLEVAIHNAKVVADRISTQKANSLEFRQNLVHMLIGDTRAKRAAPRKSADLTPERLQDVGSHLPIFVFGGPRDCKVCSKKASIKAQKFPERKKVYVTRSSIKCMHCDIHLCVAGGKNCFHEYHVKKEFWR